VVLLALDHLLRRCPHDRHEPLALPCAEAVDVEQQADPALGLAEHGKSGQLLKGVERLAVGTDEHVQIRSFEVDVASDLIDPCRDVAVDIQGVQEPFEEVTRPLGVRLDHGWLDRLIAIGAP
jgi:hypothetical protein